VPIPSNPPLRVLIVDDHAVFRDAVRDLLERRGCAVVGEADGAVAGVDAARRIAPDAVLLDVRLGEDDGFEVCRAMTRSDPRLAVLLVSADVDHHRAADVRNCGACGFVLKSRLARTDLVALWNAALGQRCPDGDQ
jgi:DNA-binding NarL/FixJ family response regulator